VKPVEYINAIFYKFTALRFCCIKAGVFSLDINDIFVTGVKVKAIPATGRGGL
jgi:hypothetical protein